MVVCHPHIVVSHDDTAKSGEYSAQSTRFRETDVFHSLRGNYTSVRCERERHQQFLHARTDEPFKAAEAQIRAGSVGLEE